MERHRTPWIILLLAAVLLFVSGVARLFDMRFSAGDAYPVYSSYRSDPQGTMAFYESLGLLPGVTSVRNTEAVGRQAGTNDAALFFIGLKKEVFTAMDGPSVEAIEKAARAGGRIVIAFASAQNETSEAAPSPPIGEMGNKGEKQGEKTENKTDGAGPPPGAFRGSVDLRDRWQLDIRILQGRPGAALLSAGDERLPPSLDWYSAIILEPRQPVWRAIYSRDGKAVIVERKMGKGEIAIASDSFFLTNEAMKEGRYTRLLAWLCGDHSTIVFDETHLGLSKSPGVAALLRKQGFTPFIVSLLLLVTLAIWRQSSQFVPPTRQGEKEETEQGRAYEAGMRNLLRRNIPPGEVLLVCFDEWERSVTRGPGSLASLTPDIGKIVAAEKALPGRNRRPVEAYGRISALVMARRRGS